MEDAVTAMIMAFSVMVFVLALSLCMYMVNQLTFTSEQILYSSDKSNFMENIKISDAGVTRREVDFDVIVPTLYRYFKENFCVKIVDATSGTEKLLHIFDIKIEGDVRSAETTEPSRRSRKQNSLVLLYGDPSKTTYLFQSPWLGNTNRDVKTRIDYYVSGSSGYINNTFVDYESKPGMFNNLVDIKNWYDGDIGEERNLIIEESFVEYNFSGDTITTEDGMETITGDKKAESKIIIIYTLKNKS